MTDIRSTRRQFLSTSAAMLAGLSAHARAGSAMASSESGIAASRRILPSSIAIRHTSPNDWLPDPPSAEHFRALALVAMDVAQHAGADYADIRVGVQRILTPPSVGMAVGYGIRARINGTWSFQHGTVLTRDAVSAATRDAVANARTAASVNTHFGRADVAELAPASVVTGAWESPVAIDPFSVSLDDYQRLRASLFRPLARIGFVLGRAVITWCVDTRVFASTVGSLVTQTTTRGGILRLNVVTNLPENVIDSVSFAVQGFEEQSIGFEVALRPDIPDRLVATAEEAIRWRALPLRPFPDVGRYPVVLGGSAMGAFVGHTANLALDGDRVAGFELDASGRSFLSPVSNILGAAAPAFSPLLTMTSGRTVPSATAVQWDDDGVVPDSYTLVDAGHVVNYHTTRETAPLLANWDRRRGRAVRSHGASVAPTPASIPMGRSGEVRVAPAAGRATVDDLVRDIGHGFLVLGDNTSVRVSPGLTAGLMSSDLVVEIQRGKPIARIPNLRLAFSTMSMLQKNLAALGDVSTTRTSQIAVQKGMPWQELVHPVTAPAALCKEIDIMRTDIGT